MREMTQQDLLYLSSTFSKAFKKRFGKGPESCQALFYKGRLYISIRNFITPAEEVLIDKGECNLAIKFRTVVMETVIKEFIESSSTVLYCDLKDAYYDWNYRSNTGFVLLEPTGLAKEETTDSTKSDLLETIRGISLQFHKRPEKLQILLSIHSICVIEVTGVQTPLENLLFNNGSTTLLQQHLREIKSGYLEHKKVLEKICNRPIEDLFLMGDYKRNKYIIIILFPKNPR